MSNTPAHDATSLALRLLQDTHEFPCCFLVKVIGRADAEFAERVLAVIRISHPPEQDLSFGLRETASGRHVSITAEPHLASAQEVLVLYERLRAVEGVVMLL